MASATNKRDDESAAEETTNASSRSVADQDTVRSTMYRVTESKIAKEALDQISFQLTKRSETDVATDDVRLRLVSMKESFHGRLLTQYYHELMIPNFPLEDERDDLDDWLYILDPAKQETNVESSCCSDQGPSMDVLLLISNKDNNDNDNDHNAIIPTIILAGIAFEYYHQAQTGLLTYMVVATDFRRLGILRSLHPVACRAMEQLHQVSVFTVLPSQQQQEQQSTTTTPDSFCSKIKAILAETNTIQAGDAPPEIIRKRHEILYRLGYRHLKFPYVQPPLAEDGESFDHIMLLMYCGDDDHASNNNNDDDNDDDSNRDTTTITTIDTQILYHFVLDFYQSVTGYDNENYQQHWYCHLAKWFRMQNPHTEIAKDLPWNDITPEIQRAMEIDSQQQDSSVPSMHVVVVGAGMAGLVATVTMAEEYMKNHCQCEGTTTQQQTVIPPLKITLVEAQPFVGGRIRTVVTDPKAQEDFDDDDNNNALLFSNDRLPSSSKVDGFAPWPVPIGAEFVHGVNSVVNRLIEDNDDWLVQETFDLCPSPQEYPSRNSFVQRRQSLTLPPEKRETSHIQVFCDGRCYPLKQKDNVGHSDDSKTLVESQVPRLIRKANELWQNLQNIISEANDSECCPDMSLNRFIDEQMDQETDNTLSNDDIVRIKQILECIFSNTSGSYNDLLGIHEASREEYNWDFTGCNFRTQHAFAEFPKYFLSRIHQINQQCSSTHALVEIKLETDCPIVEIGSHRGVHTNASSRIRLETKSGTTISCDRCIVTVPLSILKAKTVHFCDDFVIPADMQKAIDTIHMCSGMKAHMLWKIGQDIVQFSSLMTQTELFFCPGEVFSQIWLRRDENSIFFTGYCVANCRDRLLSLALNDGGHSKTEIARNLLLDQLQRIFEENDEESVFTNPDAPTCSSFALHDWSDDDYVQGIYSSPSVGAGWPRDLAGEDDKLGTNSYRDFLVQPIKGCVWLAGEHANVKSCATVQSAMESGERAAKEVLESIVRLL